MRATEGRAVLSEHDRANIDKIMAGEGSNFSAHIIRLCAKADRDNLARLRLGWPEHVAAWEEWMKGEAT